MIRRATLATSLLLAGLLPGCTNDATVQVTPTATRGDLQRRSLDLLLRAADSDLDVVRCNAIEALVQVAPTEGVSRFRASLKNESALVRFAACVAVGEVRNRESIDVILADLRDADPRVRLGASFAAYRLGQYNQAKALVQVLTDNPDENLRSDAALLIGKLGEKRAIKRLKFVATNEKSNKVLIQIYASMAALGDQEAIEKLIGFAQGDAVSRVLALSCLADLGAERARDALEFRFSGREDYLEIRLIAARGLGKLRSKVGLDLAIKSTTYTATDETDVMRVRTLAALALGEIGDRRGLPSLEKLAESQEDARIQVAASYAILKILKR